MLHRPLQIETLKSVHKNGVQYILTFQTDSGVKEIKADIVVLAIPFAVLKTIDYTHAEFDQLKVKVIKELGAGVNGKLHLQFSERYWNRKGSWGIINGTTYSDTGYQSTWDTTREQLGKSGILVKYTGGDIALKMKTKHSAGTVKTDDVAEDVKIF